ncbi:Stromal processing peptidase, chloroplastic [Zea mays]|uniref:Stromal processing peptidase, chloroplastic n=1 Tax=Zea mays TaxID=4577 RepID=A0A3L6EE99_MAIZE|nr:Stromal processing peptidase, chloroplastic [Zea mays]
MGRRVATPAWRGSSAMAGPVLAALPAAMAAATACRFEAHMEVHVGSIDEEEDEQGIAHMIEHVAFLGSKKREKILGTGARSNAYTDFHHTVFHIHSPTKTKEYGEDLLPFVLDALSEIAFHPKFSSSRVEKERRAILSELQMMNTIEYRVDCQASELFAPT